MLFWPYLVLRWPFGRCFISCFCAPPSLPSFPTRRSSDLIGLRYRVALVAAAFAAGFFWAAACAQWRMSDRSEEHTSELQSLRHLVCRLLLEKKKSKSPTRSQRPIPARVAVHRW